MLKKCKLLFKQNETSLIFSKNGKPIGNLSKFGTHSATNEQEILFQSGTQFNVLDIEENANNAVIILKEL